MHTPRLLSVVDERARNAATGQTPLIVRVRTEKKSDTSCLSKSRNYQFPGFPTLSSVRSVAGCSLILLRHHPFHSWRIFLFFRRYPLHSWQTFDTQPLIRLSLCAKLATFPHMDSVKCTFIKYQNPAQSHRIVPRKLDPCCAAYLPVHILPSCRQFTAKNLRFLSLINPPVVLPLNDACLSPAQTHWSIPRKQLQLIYWLNLFKITIFTGT